MNWSKQSLAFLVSGSVLLGGAPGGWAAAVPPAPAGRFGRAGPGATADRFGRAGDCPIDHAGHPAVTGEIGPTRRTDRACIRTR